MHMTLFDLIKACCKSGSRKDLDYVFSLLNEHIDIGTTKVIDFYLSTVNNPEGLEQIEFYLFNGTQIQRNYCTLFYLRRGDCMKVDKAFQLGLIDHIQAYSR